MVAKNKSRKTSTCRKTPMIIQKYKQITCSTEPNSDVVFIEFCANLKVDLANAREIVNDRLLFTQNRMHYLITDTSNVSHVTVEAKEFLQQPHGGLKNILGAAFIANNPVGELIANVFIKTPKNFHARVFSSREEALAWIEEYKMKMILTKLKP